MADMAQSRNGSNLLIYSRKIHAISTLNMSPWFAQGPGIPPPGSGVATRTMRSLAQWPHSVASARVVAGGRYPAVASAAVSGAKLSDAEWAEIIPAMPTRARGFLRNRSDLGPETRRALAIWSSADFVLPVPHNCRSGQWRPNPGHCRTDRAAAQRARNARSAVSALCRRGIQRFPRKDRRNPLRNR